MHNQLKTFTKDFSPNDKFTLITVALIVKAIFFVLFFPTEIVTPGMIGVQGGDTDSYFLPIEKLLNEGSYIPDYRMPGYGLIYFIIRLFIDKVLAYNIVIILQWVLSSISIYFLAKSVFIATGKTALFFITFFLYLFSTSTNVLDYYLLTESFSTSALIFSIYFLVTYMNNNLKRSAILSGLFICWSIFMRPVLLPILGIYIFVIVRHFYIQKKTSRSIIINALLICLPFIVFDSIWTIRNYIIHNKLTPLTTTQYPLDIELTYYNELMGFVIAWGGDRTWWNENAEIRWFINNEKKFGPYLKDLPDNIYTSKFNRDSLLKIKEGINIIDNPISDSSTKAKATIKIKKSLKYFTESIAQEKPFLYYIKSKIQIGWKFIAHSGTPWLFQMKFSDLSIFKKMVKITYTIFYILIMVLGFTGILILFVRSKNQHSGILLFPIISLYLLIIHPFLGHVEYRYLIPIYPLMLVCSSYTILVNLEAILNMIHNKFHKQ